MIPDALYSTNSGYSSGNRRNNTTHPFGPHRSSPCRAPYLIGFFAISIASQANIIFSFLASMMEAWGRTACTRYGTSIWCISIKPCIPLSFITVYNSIAVATPIPHLMLDHWHQKRGVNIYRSRQCEISEDEDRLFRQPQYPTPSCWYIRPQNTNGEINARLKVWKNNVDCASHILQPDTFRKVT